MFRALALAFRLRSPASSPSWVTVLCSWARHSALIVPLSTQVYKRSTGELLRNPQSNSNLTIIINIYLNIVPISSAKIISESWF